jgi:K+-sensing histidine kinase KdpD
MIDDGTGFGTDEVEDAGALGAARSAVARAAADLTHAAERLLAAEREIADGRGRVSEAERRTAELEARAKAVERALEESGHRAIGSDRRAEYAERLVAETQSMIASAEGRAVSAEQRAVTAEQYMRETEERIAAIEEGARLANERAAEAESRAGGGAQAQERLAALEARAIDAEERLEIETARSVELTRRLDEASRTARVADERADEADERAHVSLERTKQLEAELQAARGALEEAKTAPPVTVIVDEARSALQEAVATEVRRPLSSIMGLTLALKHHDAGTSEGLEMVRQLSMHARKLDRLIAEYLELDHLIDGTLKPNRRRTDVEALVRRVAEESPDLADIDVRVETSQARAAVDPVLTEQMVEALLANAGRRTPPGGSIQVKVWQDERGVTIAVEDAGERVPIALREALLDPSQLLKAGAPKGGTGLIVMSRLAQIHRGRAGVEDLPGGGAAFRVYLPTVAEDAPPDATATGADTTRPTMQDGAIAI